MKRLIALLLAALIILGTAGALAETWTCPNCGRTDNDGAFCPGCGTAKPGTTNLQPGDYVYLGHWEQNDYTGDGADPIRWIVIQVDGSKLFLLSEKALANLPFNKKSDGTSWAASTLRQWLNYDFYTGAFNAQEAAAILTTQVEDNADHTYYEWNTASRFSGTTQDKVFCLSYLEARTLLTPQMACCEPSAVTSKSKNKILVEKNNGRAYCYWWLRTSVYKNNAGCVSPAASFSNAYEHFHRLCVRPALWVDASAVTQ
ncbi:MAG: hypothetical protein IJI09_10215 [Clostridia bacterium]|nr:hypothetical protein [Clostridia bacterium]